MGSLSDLEVDPDDLRQVSTVLDDAGSTLFRRASDLQDAPDAGASSHEVATAMAALASAVAGLAQHLGDLSSNTALTGADFAGTDQAVSGAVSGAAGGARPVSDVLETNVYGEPPACTAAAGAAASVRQAVATAEERIGAARSLGGSWRGQAGAAFENRLDTAARDARDVADRIEQLERALTDFAGELGAVEEKMAQARQVAARGGVVVNGTHVLRPDSPEQLSQGQVDAHNRKVEAWNEAVAIAEAARSKETEAHRNLGAGIARSTGDGFVENLMQRLGFLPPDFAETDDVAGWLFGLGGLGVGAAVGWKVHGRYGVFQPRVSGRFGTTTGMSFWQRTRAASNKTSWHAKPYQAGTRNAWANAGRWATRAGTVVTAATAGWDQWQADADDPSMGTTERATRATTLGATTAAAAWAGAQGGAWAGGAIGTAICPGVGTVIGGVVGGVIGGAAGGFVGSEIGQEVMGPIGDAAEETADFIGDVGENAGEVLSDAGDALTFWD